MSPTSGEEVAFVLLRSLPVDLAEQLLGRLGGEPAQRLRARLKNDPASPIPPEQLQMALREFNDFKRIVERMTPPLAEAEQKKTGDSEPKTDAKVDPIQALRELDLNRLVRVLQNEQAATVSLVMSCLDSVVATEVMKRLPVRLRPDVTIRLVQPGLRNQPLLEEVARAVIQKAEKLVDAVPELTSADRDKNVAFMLRALNRTERKEIMDALQASDPDTGMRIGALLYQFEDIMRVDDRGLQTILIELDMKTLAMALNGAEANLVAKVSNNISSRARDMLNEEIGLLGTIPNSRIQEARNKIIGTLKQFEEEGKIMLAEE